MDTKTIQAIQRATEGQRTLITRTLITAMQVVPMRALALPAGIVALCALSLVALATQTLSLFIFMILAGFGAKAWLAQRRHIPLAPGTETFAPATTITVGLVSIESEAQRAEVEHAYDHLAARDGAAALQRRYRGVGRPDAARATVQQAVSEVEVRGGIVTEAVVAMEGAPFPIGIITLTRAPDHLHRAAFAPVQVWVTDRAARCVYLLLLLVSERSEASLDARSTTDPDTQPANRMDRVSNAEASSPMGDADDDAATGTTRLQPVVAAAAPAPAAAPAAPPVAPAAASAAPAPDLFASLLAAAPPAPHGDDLAALRQRVITGLLSQADAPAAAPVEPAPAPPPARIVVVDDRILVGYDRATGEPITTTLPRLAGLMILIYGIKGSGKTSSALGLVQRTAQTGRPWAILYDEKGEMRGLRHGPGALPIVVAGHAPYADLRLSAASVLADPFETREEAKERIEILRATVGQWARATTALARERQSFILDTFGPALDSVEGRQTILTVCVRAFLQVAQAQRQPWSVLIDEAQNVISGGRGGMPKPLYEAARTLTRTARAYGVSCTFVCQRPKDVHPDFRTQADMAILHKVGDPLDLDAYAELLWWPAAKVRSVVETLSPGEAIIAARGVLQRGDCPLLEEPVVVKMQPATTAHISYTPGAGPAPILPPILSLTADQQAILARLGGQAPTAPRTDAPAPPPTVSAAPAPTEAAPQRAGQPRLVVFDIDVPAPAAPPPAPAPAAHAAPTELSGAARWPEPQRDRVIAALKRPHIHAWATACGSAGYRIPLTDRPGQKATSPFIAAQLKDERLMRLIDQALKIQISQNDLGRLLFGSSPGTDSSAIGQAHAAWTAQQDAPAAPTPTTVLAEQTRGA